MTTSATPRDMKSTEKETAVPKGYVNEYDDADVRVCVDRNEDDKEVIIYIDTHEGGRDLKIVVNDEPVF